MWSQVVAALLVLIVATYAVQLFLPRDKTRPGTRRNYARWDVAPLLGFIGALVLALSLTEAMRGAVIEAWAWGLGLGLAISVAFGIVLIYSNNAPSQKNESALRATLRFVRTYGVLAIFTVIGVYLAVRIVGAALEVFVGSAVGVWLVAMAVALFTRFGRQASDNKP
jgi:divalent metal cation (Fe/Co/Zn/Cd) transporter